MRFIKTLTTDGEIEVFNMEHILNIRPFGDKCKILMGAGLYWWVYSDSIELLESPTELLNAIREVKE